MDHAAAHERIEDLLLDPRRLADLAGSTAPDDVALREHVAGCAACRADLDGWRDLGAAISGSLPRSTDEALAVTEPTELPPSMRAAVLARARSEPRGASTGSKRWTGSVSAAAGTSEPIAIDAHRARRSRFGPLLALAASLIVIVGSVGLVMDQANQRHAAEAEAAALTSALGAVNRVLAAPGHVVVPLQDPSGTNAGSISWSRHDWVVITNALARPSSGQSYLCWLEVDGRSTLVGSMQFAGDTAFWVASVDRWATWEITPATRFVVTLQATGSTQLEGETLLEAALGA
ncbi:MAG TPA: anti-sigma factor, partial [Candidatus Limnocylindrales bacterium]|nr:anti-sigma factor [Candidatus Limnocylindrales bacterium]